MERREEIDRDAKEGRSSSCVHFLRFRDAFDFYPSGRGERSRNDRAQRRWHARSVSDGSFPSFRLISIAAKRGKGKNYRVFQRLGDLSRGTWPTTFERKKRDRNGLARLAARFSRKIGTPVNASPVAVGRGRELESPFAIIYFKTF